MENWIQKILNSAFIDIRDQYDTSMRIYVDQGLSVL